MIKVTKRNIFDERVSLEVKEKTPLQKLREMRDYSTLVLKAADIPSELVRATLKYSRGVLSSLTLDGSWKDEDFKTFTPYMDNVISLRLVNISFTDAAFDEAFVSKLSYENPFEDTLDTYEEGVDRDEWSSTPVILPKHSPLYTEASLSAWIPPPHSDYEEKSSSPKSTTIAFDEDGLNIYEEHIETGGSINESIDFSSAWIPPPRPVSEKKSSPNSIISSCPKLKELIIENPTNLTVGFLLKLLPLKDQLISITLIKCPQALSAEIIRDLFHNLQTIVIN